MTERVNGLPPDLLPKVTEQWGKLVEKVIQDEVTLLDDMAKLTEHARNLFGQPLKLKGKAEEVTRGNGMGQRREIFDKQSGGVIAPDTYRIGKVDEQGMFGTFIHLHIGDTTYRCLITDVQPATDEEIMAARQALEALPESRGEDD